MSKTIIPFLVTSKYLTFFCVSKKELPLLFILGMSAENCLWLLGGGEGGKEAKRINSHWELLCSQNWRIHPQWGTWKGISTTELLKIIFSFWAAGLGEDWFPVCRLHCNAMVRIISYKSSRPLKITMSNTFKRLIILFYIQLFICFTSVGVLYLELLLTSMLFLVYL